MNNHEMEPRGHPEGRCRVPLSVSCGTRASALSHTAATSIFEFGVVGTTKSDTAVWLGQWSGGNQEKGTGSLGRGTSQAMKTMINYVCQVSVRA